jgi:hypothetical protein
VGGQPKMPIVASIVYDTDWVVVNIVRFNNLQVYEKAFDALKEKFGSGRN